MNNKLVTLWGLTLSTDSLIASIHKEHIYPPDLRDLKYIMNNHSQATHSLFNTLYFEMIFSYK